MNPGLSGKTGLVTGAGSGIGRAIAAGFGRERSKVIVADIDSAGGRKTVDDIKAAGGEAAFFQVDVSDAAAVEGMVRFAAARYGRLDFAVNNAGCVLNGRLLHEFEEAEWDRLVAVNLKGVWLSMKYEIRQMMAQGGGVIVNMASAAGVEGQQGAAVYSASKHGVIGLTKTAALEYGRQGIRVNAICPGLILTPDTGPLMADPALRSRFEGAHALGRIGKPEEVASAAVWLCSEAASFVTGHSLFVDGGVLAGKTAVSTMG